MKTLKYSLLLILSFIAVLRASAQEKTDKIVKEISFNRKSDNNVMQVENIFGSVEVETHNSDKVVFEVERIIEYHNESGLKKAEELSLDFKVEGDSIIAFLKAPYIYSRTNNGGQTTSVNIDKKLEYEFKYNFKVKVPQNTNIAIMTVNDGDLKVKNLTAKRIEASNVNGPIMLENVSAEVEAKTVNGDVLVNYKENPRGKSTFETINGNIELLYKNKLSALIDFNSFNGDFYTDIEDLQKMPAKVEKTATSNGSKTKYKVDKSSSFKTGSGTAQLSINTFNGKGIVKAGK